MALLTAVVPGAQQWTREAFGSPSSDDAAAVEHVRLVTSDGWAAARVEADVPMPPVLSKKQKLAVDALLAPHLVAGRGHREGANRMVAMGGRDRFTVSVEFGQRALQTALQHKDWAAVEDLVRARLFDVPPSGLGTPSRRALSAAGAMLTCACAVETAIAETRKDALAAMAECCLGMQQSHVAAILSYAAE